MPEFTKGSRLERIADAATWTERPWWYRMWVSVGLGASRRIDGKFDFPLH